MHINIQFRGVDVNTVVFGVIEFLQADNSYKNVAMYIK